MKRAGQCKKKAPSLNQDQGLRINFGDALLSHAVTHAVPSALKSLTSVFGMGTGGTSSLESPKTDIRFSEFSYQFIALN